MRIKRNFHLIDIADEHFIVPAGEEAASFNGVVALNEEASFLINLMSGEKSKEELVNLLISEYSVDESTARHDIDCFLLKISEMGLLENE